MDTDDTIREQAIEAAAKAANATEQPLHRQWNDAYDDEQQSWRDYVTPLVDAALNRDYTLVMGTVVVIAIFIIVFNLIVDLLYAVVDPRVRFD